MKDFRHTGTPHRVVTHRVRKVYSTYKNVYESPDTGIRQRALVGEATVEITLTVDLDGIVAELGDRAWNNKSKRARFMHGLIVVEARKI